MPVSMPTRSTPAVANKPAVEYPTLDEDKYCAQFAAIFERKEKSFDTRNSPDDEAEWQDKIVAKFYILTEDGEAASGHGKAVYLSVNKPRMLAPPREGKKVSNAWLMLLGLYGKKELSMEEIEGANDFLNSLEQQAEDPANAPQFFINVAVTSGGKNKVSKVLRPVPAKQRLAPFVPPQREADPREANDDPNLVCSVTGRVIHGWETNDGTWMDNRAWVDLQFEKLGREAVYTFEDRPGEFFAAPFAGRYYKLAKEQAERVTTADNSADLPF